MSCLRSLRHPLIYSSTIGDVCYMDRLFRYVSGACFIGKAGRGYQNGSWVYGRLSMCPRFLPSCSSRPHVNAVSPRLCLRHRTLVSSAPCDIVSMSAPRHAPVSPRRPRRPKRRGKAEYKQIKLIETWRSLFAERFVCMPPLCYIYGRMHNLALSGKARRGAHRAE